MFNIKDDRVRPLKYLIAGGSAFFIDYVVFLILHYYVSLNTSVSGSLSFLSGLLFSFSLQRFWTFNKRGTNEIKKHLLFYFLLAIFNLLFTAVALDLSETYIPPYMAKFIIIATIAVWNYSFYRKIFLEERTLATQD